MSDIVQRIIAGEEKPSEAEAKALRDAREYLTAREPDLKGTSLSLTETLLVRGDLVRYFSEAVRTAQVRGRQLAEFKGLIWSISPEQLKKELAELYADTKNKEGVFEPAQLSIEEWLRLEEAVREKLENFFRDLCEQILEDISWDRVQNDSPSYTPDLK